MDVKFVAEQQLHPIRHRHPLVVLTAAAGDWAVQHVDGGISLQRI